MEECSRMRAEPAKTKPLAYVTPKQYWKVTQITTGVDLSKILGGQTKILGRQKVIKSDMHGRFLIIGARARAAPKVCACAAMQITV